MLGRSGSVLVLALGLLGAALLGAAPVEAQGEGGIAGSGMSDGHAHITTRADVAISLESAPGTGSARVQAWGRAMSATMTAIRRCYDTVVGERPTVQGSMRILMQLPERGGITLEVSEDTTGDAPLLRCVRRAIGDTALDELHRPSGVYAVLTFSNTAAASAEAGAAAAAEADVIAVTREGGIPSASGEAREGLLRWVVRGDAETSDALVADGFRVLRSQIAGLLDCRRRAGRRGRDPSGALVVSLRLRAGRAADSTVRSSTVADATAGRCVTQRLDRAPHRPGEAGTVEAEITFLP